LNHNAKIEKYLNDADIMSVAWGAAASFSRILSKDEIQSCIMNALWRASKRFKKDKNTKFTSYIHKGVTYECLSQSKLTRSKGHKVIHQNIEDERNPFDTIDMIDMIQEKCDDPSLIIDRFYNKMTIKELSKSHNVCGETIRIRLKKNLEKLKVSMTNGVL
jgi:DNA-directed RNA polymerase specialized sigma24 family protein